MDMLYALRVHAINQYTMDYINCIGGELNDLERKYSSPKLIFKRVIMRLTAALAIEQSVFHAVVEEEVPPL